MMRALGFTPRISMVLAGDRPAFVAVTMLVDADDGEQSTQPLALAAILIQFVVG
ncbi:MAG TPA: hypothetical protein VMT89_07130 [Candidatus Acidoferrales bacterium]|nr:hypothetical protein [Candidatus Acidoferrales bacterium]